MIPLRVALPLLAFIAFFGWTVGGYHAERVAAIEWTKSSITRQAKADQP